MKTTRLLITALAIILTACIPTATPTLKPSRTNTATPQPSSIHTETPLPTNTPAPSATSSPSPTPPPADLIFINSNILTMEDIPAKASAIAVRGEMIIAVGDDEAILALRGANTQIIDLEGQTMMPGFVNPHTHLLNDAWRMEMDLISAQQFALENGMTTLANMFTTDVFLEEMQALQQAGDLRVRTSLYLLGTDNCGNLAGDWWLSHPPTREPGEMLRIGGIKVFTDGGSCGNPAVSQSFAPYYEYGDLFLSDEQLLELYRQADEAGYQIVTHAIGDRAIEQALNAYETILDGQPNTLRHRIDHNSVLRDDLLPRFGQLGIIPVVFGYYRVCDVATDFPEFYTTNAWRWNDLAAANPELPIAWHGDEPWVGTGNPFLDILSLTTRYSQADDGSLCAPPPWLAEKTLPVESVLRMMTINAAYALHRESEVGSLASGKFADLIIISADPTAVDLLEIQDIQVLVTMVGGKVEFCAEGTEQLCPAQ